jgi:hypothetical protein
MLQTRTPRETKHPAGVQPTWAPSSSSRIARHTVLETLRRWAAPRGERQADLLRQRVDGEAGLGTDGEGRWGHRQSTDRREFRALSEPRVSSTAPMTR